MCVCGDQWLTVCYQKCHPCILGKLVAECGLGFVGTLGNQRLTLAVIATIQTRHIHVFKMARYNASFEREGML